MQQLPDVDPSLVCQDQENQHPRRVHLHQVPGEGSHPTNESTLTFFDFDSDFSVLTFLGMYVFPDDDFARFPTRIVCAILPINSHTTVSSRSFHLFTNQFIDCFPFLLNAIEKSCIPPHIKEQKEMRVKITVVPQSTRAQRSRIRRAFLVPVFVELRFTTVALDLVQWFLVDVFAPAPSRNTRIKLTKWRCP